MLRQRKLGRHTLAAALILMVLAVPGVAAPPEDGGVPGTPATPQGIPETLPPLDLTSQRPDPAEIDRLATKAQREGSVRVIVGLPVLYRVEGELTEAELAAQRGNIAARGNDVRSALRGRPHTVNHAYEAVPYMALSVSAAAVRALAQSGGIASIQEDVLERPELGQSIPLIQQTELNGLPRTGNGRIVAVLDTGVQKAHTFLQRATGGTKVVAEACYALGSDGIAGAGNCPGGASTSVAFGSGEPCTGAPTDCRHGTHVAGIAVGRSATLNGVARDGLLISINIFSIFASVASCSPSPAPCALTWTSDQIAGLNRLILIRPSFPALSSVNMSIGGSSSSANCDGDSRKPAIDTLRSFGIATVIAAGNNGFANAVSFPSCISTAITVGSTTDVFPETVSSFSNSSPLVELLAPGSNITSSVPGVGTFATFSGTSMATPHVAGAWAVLKYASPGASVPAVLDQFAQTGRLVSVTRGAFTVTKPAIRVLPASARLSDLGIFPFRVYDFPAETGGGVASNGIGLAGRAGGKSSGNIVINKVPTGAVPVEAWLYWQTYGGADSTVLFNGVSRVGTLVGISRDPCWTPNQSQPIRTYRAFVGALGNGTYPISGVGAVAAQGQGASLVAVYRGPAGSDRARISLSNGARTISNVNTVATAYLSTPAIPPLPLWAYVNVGIGDGQGLADNPLTFEGSAITLPNSFNGSDGPMWDDRRYPVPVSLLAPGATLRIMSNAVAEDCLTWPYATLTYEFQ
jgi:subtilisin